MASHPGHRDRNCRKVGGKLCPACFELLEVVRRIKEASLRIGEFYKKQSKLRSKVNDPVVRYLPVELVSQIFELCLPPHDHDISVNKRDMDLSSKFSPLRFGAVCRAWRNIAWATPRLWTFLSINLSSKLLTGNSWAGYSIVKAWLARTGVLPLSIRMYKSTYVDYHAEVQVDHSIIDLVNKYSRRCHDLDLALPDQLLSKVALGSQRRLKNLRVKVTQIRRPIMGTRFYGLKRWDSLTTWNASSIYTDEILNVFMNAPRLTKCALHNVQERPQILEPPTPLTRRDRDKPFTYKPLSYIKFEPSELQATVLFRDLTLPALERLEFSWWNTLLDESESIFNHLTSCIKRSLPPLDTLCLTLPAAPSSMVVPLLRGFPSLRHLYFCRPFQSDLWSTIFSHLGRPSSIGRSSADDVLLPRLRVLTFAYPQNTGPYASDWDAIIDTLEGTLAFERITILYAEAEERGPLWYRDQVIKLANLIQAGVPLEIASGGPDGSMNYADLIKFRNELNEE